MSRGSDGRAPLSFKSIRPRRDPGARFPPRLPEHQCLRAHSRRVARQPPRPRWLGARSSFCPCLHARRRRREAEPMVTRPSGPARAPPHQLVLKAVLARPPWQAIVAGPAEDSPATRSTSPSAAFQRRFVIPSITHDEGSHVRAADTTWTLLAETERPMNARPRVMQLIAVLIQFSAAHVAFAQGTKPPPLPARPTVPPHKPPSDSVAIRIQNLPIFVPRCR